MSKFAFFFLCFFFPFIGGAQEYGISLYGDLKYPNSFTHFDYVNPTAPKGGTLRQATFSSFDTLNPFALQGRSPTGIGLVFDTLLAQSGDEVFSLYGLVAQSIEQPSSKEIIFYINPKARFQNGERILPLDVLETFKTLKEKGQPFYRAYYKNVMKAEQVGENGVRFVFDKENRELPLILGQLPILSHKDLETRDFKKTTLTPLISSGPYKIASFDGGRYILYERDKTYWAKDLPVNKGRYNFDFIRYDVYRDSTVALEGLKAGAFDIRIENESKKWVNAYPKDVLLKKNLKKQEFYHRYPSGMQGFVFNTRRPIFKDRRVRKALNYAFDFNWVNFHLFNGLYKRTESYFDNSVLKAPPLPSKEELLLLSPFKKDLPPELFDTPFKNPKAHKKEDYLKALSLLKDAGWQVDKQGLLRDLNGNAFSFEILLEAGSQSTWERVFRPLLRNLEKLGIKASLRFIDSVQYKNRLDSFDFDMIVHVFGQSLSPGNEQRYSFGGASSTLKGTSNFAGAKSPVVDFLIEKIVEAKTYSELKTAVHAFDRVLLFNYYVIPNWYTPCFRVVFRDIFGIPQKAPFSGIDIQSWWIK
ncbi:MAG: extracellular solute-binding protein [Alphaproteobacteria bacterium]|nr:extracellular solute-binding protein [Alphaproteobacteria bacterium]